MSPFSLVRSLSRGTVAQFRGSSRGRGLGHDSAAYRTGLKFFTATADTGLAVIPTQTSPFRANSLWEIVHPKLRSNRFDGFCISTATVPLNLERFTGRRISTRVVYGTFAVRTTAGPGAGQSYTLAVPLTRNSSSTYPI